MRPQREVLEDHADLRADRCEFAVGHPVSVGANADGLAEQPDTAGIRRFKPVDTAQQRRFARPGGPEDADGFAGRDGEVDAVKHFLAFEALHEALDLEHGLGRTWRQGWGQGH
jgi:hypothetical protein